jgi:predicted nucleotidyltransferase
LDHFICDYNPFHHELQVILDTYRNDLPQLIIIVNHYNAAALKAF